MQFLTAAQNTAVLRVDLGHARLYTLYMETNRSAARKEANQGMNWIRPAKRLAIYLRDGLACAWCGDSVENGAKLTLDHLVPYSKGGSHDAKNLVTSCARCNSARGNRSVAAFSRAVTKYLGAKESMSVEIVANIRKMSKRVLNVAAAKELIEARGGFVNACRG